LQKNVIRLAVHHCELLNDCVNNFLKGSEKKKLFYYSNKVKPDLNKQKIKFFRRLFYKL